REVQRIEARPGRGAGTTVSGVVLAEVAGEPYWIVVNLGASRTYRLARGVLEQISVDHSEVQELIDAGTVTRAQAAHHPRRHVVTRAIGAAGGIDVDYWLLPVSRGDRMLVCSDGLTGELSDHDVTTTLLAESDPQAAAERLVAQAVRAGGRDNVTVVVVDVREIDGQDDGSSATTPREAALTDEDTQPRAGAAREVARWAGTSRARGSPSSRRTQPCCSRATRHRDSCARCTPRSCRARGSPRCSRSSRASSRRA